jgi:hypothetical protein
MQWWQRLDSRVRARELQLKSWRHLLAPGTAQQTEALLALVEIARILALCLAFVGGVMLGSESRAAGIVACGVAWPLLMVARLVVRDRVLGRAFAGIRAPVAANVVSPAFAASSVAHKAKPAKVEPVAKPKLSDSDRDAVDFDDA